MNSYLEELVLLDALVDGTVGASIRLVLIASWSSVSSSLSALFLVLDTPGSVTVSATVMVALVLMEGVNI